VNTLGLRHVKAQRTNWRKERAKPDPRGLAAGDTNSQIFENEELHDDVSLVIGLVASQPTIEPKVQWIMATLNRGGKSFGTRITTAKC